jgi:DNA-directed RNA polymerase subunit RPC12/RpoP
MGEEADRVNEQGDWEQFDQEAEFQRRTGELPYKTGFSCDMAIMDEIHDLRNDDNDHAPTCPYCGERAVLKDSSAVYGRSYGMIYICWNYPQCDAYVGVHRGSTLPLGTMANAELREWRKKAHAAFDPLWKSGAMTRVKAYKWMRNQLHLSKDESHVAMFDIERCKALIAAVEARNAKSEDLT